ncbi:Probable polyol transporter 3 [Linum perenne]
MLGGILLACLLINCMGRKYPIALGPALYAVGVGMFTFTSDYTAYKVGRIFMAIGLGFGIMIGPVYIAETAPANRRGLLGYLPQFLMCMGSTLAYVMQYRYSVAHTERRWQVAMGLLGVPSIVCTGVVLIWLPESPSYLAVRGKLETAKTLLVEKLECPNEEAEDRIKQWRMASNISTTRVTRSTPVYNPPNRSGICEMWSQLFGHSIETLMIVLVLHIVRVMSGDFAVVANIKTALILFNTDDFSFELVLAINLLLTVVKTAGSLVALFTVDRLGRMKLVTIGMCLTMIGTEIVGMSAILNLHGHLSDGTTYIWSVLGAIVVEAGVGVGVGGIPWLYGPEAFRFHARALGVGLAVIVGQLLLTIVSTKGVTIYDSTEMACRMMLIPTLLMPIAVGVSCKYMKDARKKVLLDVEVEQPQPQPQPPLEPNP